MGFGGCSSEVRGSLSHVEECKTRGPRGVVSSGGASPQNSGQSAEEEGCRRNKHTLSEKPGGSLEVGAAWLLHR